MKKIISITLSVIMIFSLVACNAEDITSSTSDTTNISIVAKQMCANCNEKITTNDKFCGKCGFKTNNIGKICSNCGEEASNKIQVIAQAGVFLVLKDLRNPYGSGD